MAVRTSHNIRWDDRKWLIIWAPKSLRHSWVESPKKTLFLPKGEGHLTRSYGGQPCCWCFSRNLHVWLRSPSLSCQFDYLNPTNAASFSMLRHFSLKCKWKAAGSVTLTDKNQVRSAAKTGLFLHTKASRGIK